MTLSPSEIISRLPQTFEKSLASGELLFFPSQGLTFPEFGTDVHVRLCPALQKKPALPTPDFETKPLPPGNGKGFDPFLPPYNDLYVGELSTEDEEYVVLLNKYAVVRDHFLLVTKKFATQTSPLTPPDLVQTYSLLMAAQKSGKPMFAFYNCGDLSGASQPHKHLQFIPVPREEGPPIERLAKSAVIESPRKPFSLPSLPYANHVFRFPPHLSSMNEDDREGVLHHAFMSLLDLTISSIRHDPTYPTNSPSFNVIMTLEHLHLIPRAKEKYVMPTGEEISVNSLGFAGMLLVKSEQEFEAVKKHGVGRILRGVSVASVHQVQCDIDNHL